MPETDFLETSIMGLLLAALVHVSLLKGGADVTCQETAEFLKKQDLPSLDSVLSFSPDKFVRGAWMLSLNLETKTRASILDSVITLLEEQGDRNVPRDEAFNFVFESGQISNVLDQRV